MKLVIASSLEQGEAAFSSLGEVLVCDETALIRDDLLDADALIVRSKTRVDEDLLGDTPVKFVGTATAGTDHVDEDWLSSAGIHFFSAKGCNANSVTEYVLSAVLEWAELERCDLSRLSLGIVGVGQVGARLSRKMKALGVQVRHCDPPLDEEGDGSLGPFHDLRDVMEECDVVSFHVPLVDGGPWPTREMITPDLVHRMRRGSLLINSSRGEIATEEAYSKGVDSGRIGALVLDVFPKEPLLSDELLGRCLYATPHIAGHSFEGRLNGTVFCAEACAQFFDQALSWQPEWPQPIRALPEDGRLIDTVRRVYDIRQDADRFGKFYTGEHSDRIESFQYLRRNYPLRFEAGRYTVPTLTPELEALGFLESRQP
jgi:erythronate-4-phosphate dehydrogenase